jgi:hypothetical protein
MANRTSTVAAGLLLFLLISLVVYSLQVSLGTTKLEEGFGTTPEQGITRAADCNCMPGYIPSKNEGLIKEGQFYFCQRLGDPRNTMKCY